MTVGIAHLQPIVSLISGVLILLMPRLLNYIVARLWVEDGRCQLSYLMLPRIAASAPGRTASRDRAFIDQR